MKPGCILSKIFAQTKVTGIVAVPSGRVTTADMDRADEAAHDCSFEHLVCQHRLYFELSDGHRIRNPEGHTSTVLTSHWLYTLAIPEEIRKLGEFKSMTNC